MRRFYLSTETTIQIVRLWRPDLVERRCTHSFHPTLTGNVVTLQLSVQGSAADAQHLAGQHLVAVNLLEDPLDGHPFDVFQIRGHIRGRVPRGQNHSRSEYSDRGWKIGDMERFVPAEGNGPLDAVFQLTHVAWPVVIQEALHGSRAHLQTAPGCVAVDKPMYQHGDVGPTFAQSW